MGFATVFDVERYQPGRAPFSQSTKPTASMVGEICIDVTAEVQGALEAVGFDLSSYPTGVPTLAQRQLISVSAKIAATEVEKVAPNRTSDTIKHYEKMSESALKALLADGPFGMTPDQSGTGGVAFSPSTGTRALFGRDMVL